MASVNSPTTVGGQRKMLRLGVSLLLLIVLLLLVYELWISYREQINAAERTTRNYAAILETGLDATLRRADASLRELSQELSAEALTQHDSDRHASAVRSTLDARLQDFDELSALRVFDANGDLLYTSGPDNTPRINVADRDYFRMLRENPRSAPVFSEVLTSRATDRPSLVVARPVQGAHGDLLGIVTAVLKLDRYQTVFQAVDLGRYGSISLRRTEDKSLVVRWPPIADAVNKPLDPQHPVRQWFGTGNATNTPHFAGQADGINRVYSLQQLDRYPFYFVIGLSLEDVLAGWRTRVLVVGVSGLLLFAALGVLLLRVWRSERREAQFMANLVDNERQLRANSERLDMFQRLVDNAGQGIGMARADGSIIYANRAAYQILELPADVACSDYSFDQFYDDETRRSLRQEVLPVVLEVGHWTGELELTTLGGRRIPAIHKLFVVRDTPGEEPVIANLLVDLSERQQMEARNHELLAEMQTLLSNAMIGIVRVNERRIIYCNRRIEEMFGYQPGELVGELSEKFYPSREVFEDVGARAYASIAKDREFATEVMLRRKDGSLFWGALGGRAIDPGQPQRGSIWVFTDISERRQAEEESQKLLQAVEQSPVAIIITDRHGVIEYINPGFTRASGYSRQEAMGRNPGFLKSGETSAETYRDLWHTLLKGEVWSGLLHNRRKNGELFWERASISPVLDSQGEVTHYLAVKEDVSERRVAETRLRLLAGVFEHSAEAIMVTDRDNLILEVNKSFSRLTGYDPEEVQGMNPRLLSSGRSTADEYRAMWHSIKVNGHWQGEIWDRRKDGSCYPKWLAISTIRGADGNIEYYIGSFVDISERKAAEEKISHLAHFDTLTDLPNRSNLQGRLDQALAAARRRSQCGALAVMFLDLDRFKNINDTLGHHVGDALLLQVSQSLRASVRESDVVARLGGDEFVVVLTGADAVAAEQVASKLLKALSQTYHIDGHSLHTTSSIGIAVFPGDGETVDILMRNADAAMYHAKSAGRNNVKFFTASMNEIASDRRQLEEDLHLALQQKQFLLHYQPQLDAHGRVFAAEALLRWQHPEHGLVPPSRFIPLAEDTGLIVPIGQRVLEAACAQLQQWSLSERTRELQLAVNVSARQFRQADFVDQLRGTLTNSGAKPERLKLELTESLVLDNVADTIAKMNAIKVLGVTFAMDDFGTGYSSLSYLTQLPLDQLKIDRAFVSRLPDNQSDAVIAQTIITMARSLDLKVVAEGVETKPQQRFLDNHGCDAYQGYLFSRPLPIEEFERFLKDSAR